jgi:hypothetical protein
LLEAAIDINGLEGMDTLLVVALDALCAAAPGGCLASCASVSLLVLFVLTKQVNLVPQGCLVMLVTKRDRWESTSQRASNV